MLSSLFNVFYVVFLTYDLSVTVLTLWVAPPKMLCNWYSTEADKGQSQNIYEIRKNVFKI